MGGYGHGFGLMGGWGGGTMFPFSGIYGLLVLALIIAALIWLVRTIVRPHDREPRTGRTAVGLDVLDQRYARGEVNREEYLQKRVDLLG